MKKLVYNDGLNNLCLKKCLTKLIYVLLAFNSRIGCLTLLRKVYFLCLSGIVYKCLFASYMQPGNLLKWHGMRFVISLPEKREQLQKERLANAEAKVEQQSAATESNNTDSEMEIFDMCCSKE